MVEVCGGLGTVYSGKYKTLPLAIKRFKDEFSEIIEIVLKEVEIMKRFRHPNVPLFYGICHKDQNSDFHLILELIRGQTLKNYVNENKLSEIELILLFLEFASVLELFHSFGFIHRDIKPSNIMVSSVYFNLKIIDFGISKSSQKTQTTTLTMGTVRYMAPENFEVYDHCNESSESNKSKISSKVDSWAFGLTLSEMFSKKLPWAEVRDQNNNHLMALLMNKVEFKVPKEIKNEEIVELIKNCTKINKNERFNSTQIKNSLLKILFIEIQKISNKKLLNKINFVISDLAEKEKPINFELKKKYLIQYKRILSHMRRRSFNENTQFNMSHISGSTKNSFNEDSGISSLNRKINQLYVQLEYSPLNPNLHKKRFSLKEEEIRLCTSSKNKSKFSSESKKVELKEINDSPSTFKLDDKAEYKELLLNLTKIDMQLEESAKEKQRRRSLGDSVDLKNSHMNLLGQENLSSNLMKKIVSSENKHNTRNTSLSQFNNNSIKSSKISVHDLNKFESSFRRKVDSKYSCGIPSFNLNSKLTGTTRIKENILSCGKVESKIKYISSQNFLKENQTNRLLQNNNIKKKEESSHSVAENNNHHPKYSLSSLSKKKF